MTIEQQFVELNQLTIDFARTINRCQFPNIESRRWGAALLDQSHEHAAAIAHLFRLNLPGSALALLRGQLEMMIRGSWLWRIATEEDLERFLRPDAYPHIANILPLVERAVEDEDGVLSRIKDTHWPTLCDYAHGGTSLAGGRMDSDAVAVVYPDGLKSGWLRMSRFMFFFAAVETLHLAGEEEFAIEWTERFMALENSGTEA